MDLCDFCGTNDNVVLSVADLISIIQSSTENEIKLKIVRNAINANVPVVYIKGMLNDFTYQGGVDGPYYGKEDMCSDD